MPIQHAIWKVGAKPQPLGVTTLPNEQLLETMIEASPEILSPEWMLNGRQEQTGFGGRIDLLAIAPDGSLVAPEMVSARNRCPAPRPIFGTGHLFLFERNLTEDEPLNRAYETRGREIAYRLKSTEVA